jgi:hypothetical protein
VERGDARLRQGVATSISPGMIEAACKKAGYRWRARKLGPIETICFLLQEKRTDTDFPPS